MATEVQFGGVKELNQLARELEKVANGGIQRHMDARITAVVRPVQALLPASALRTLPKRGGLNRKVAATPFKLVRRSTPRGTRIALLGQSTYSISKMDLPGTVRHPVFGHRDNWVRERVNPGWFTKPTQAAAAAIRPAIIAAMEDAFDEVRGSR